MHYLKKKKTTLINYIKYMASTAHPLSVLAIKAFAWAISKCRNSKRFNSVAGPGHTWWAKFKSIMRKKSLPKNQISLIEEEVAWVM